MRWNIWNIWEDTSECRVVGNLLCALRLNAQPCLSPLPWLCPHLLWSEWCLLNSSWALMAEKCKTWNVGIMCIFLTPTWCSGKRLLFSLRILLLTMILPLLHISLSWLSLSIDRRWPRGFTTESQALTQSPQSRVALFLLVIFVCFLVIILAIK